jgi:hypothetical protein
MISTGIGGRKGAALAASYMSLRDHGQTGDSSQARSNWFRNLTNSRLTEAFHMLGKIVFL